MKILELVTQSGLEKGRLQELLGSNLLTLLMEVENPRAVPRLPLNRALGLTPPPAPPVRVPLHMMDFEAAVGVANCRYLESHRDELQELYCPYKGSVVIHMRTLEDLGIKGDCSSGSLKVDKLLPALTQKCLRMATFFEVLQMAGHELIPGDPSHFRRRVTSYHQTPRGVTCIRTGNHTWYNNSGSDVYAFGAYTERNFVHSVGQGEWLPLVYE